MQPFIIILDLPPLFMFLTTIHLHTSSSSAISLLDNIESFPTVVSPAMIVPIFMVLARGSSMSFVCA